MASRRGKSAAQVNVHNTPTAAMTFTVPVPKPRNPLAMNPLLKKSAAHADRHGRNKRGRDSVQDVLRDAQDD